MKSQISESLDKYLRNIFQADDPCRDWLNLAVFDSKGPVFGRHFVCLPKSLIPQFLALEFVNWFQVNFATWGRESVFSQFLRFGACVA